MTTGICHITTNKCEPVIEMMKECFLSYPGRPSIVWKRCESLNLACTNWTSNNYKYLTYLQGLSGMEEWKSIGTFLKLQKHEAMHHFTDFDLLCLDSYELHYSSMNSYNLERVCLLASDSLKSKATI